MELNLESLGITKEELQDRVIDRICERLMSRSEEDDEGHYVSDSQFLSKLHESIRTRVDCSIEKIVEAHILPHGDQFLEKLSLQKTNRWGEKQGDSVTFIEYLTEAAEKWMTEPVDFQGKAKGSDSFHWRAEGTRLAYMIHQHLHFHVETAMKNAIQEANSHLVQALKETASIQLDKISKGLKVVVETPR